MLQMLYSVLQNLIGNQLLFGLKWIQYKCIGVELYSCSTYHKGNARARSKEEHTVYRQKMITSIIKFQKMHMKVWKRFSLVTMLVLC